MHSLTLCVITLTLYSIKLLICIIRSYHIKKASAHLLQGCQSIMHLLSGSVLAALLFLTSFATGLYFNLENDQEKVFNDWVTKNTFLMINYSIEVEQSDRSFKPDPSIHLFVKIEEESKGARHPVLNQSNTGSGRFFFTTGESTTHYVKVHAARPIVGGRQSNLRIPRVLVSVEFLYGEPGKPNIVSYVEANLSTASKIADSMIKNCIGLGEEQKVLMTSSDRSKRIYSKVKATVLKLGFVQLACLIGVSAWQYYSMQKFILYTHLRG